MEPVGKTRDALSFGPFTLVPSERLLTRDGAPVELGGRALDILIALVSQPNRTVSKKELIAQVWPDVTVGEGSLRFHIAGLRKALGDGEKGARYITTLSGQGYCFVAQISRASEQRTVHAPVAANFPRASMPTRLVRMVGRADGVRMLSTQLITLRFVTIVGAGGVGKTTVAVAVAHDLIEAFGGFVLFVDLGSLSDPNLVAASLAVMLGLSVQSNDPTPGLIAYLRDKRILLVFDNCEHIIEAAAPLAAGIFAAAPQVHILATSREALRVDGEHVHRLAPLACPPDEPGLTAASALTFPAVQLFVERAAAGGAPLNLSDSDAAVVARLCRKLDGLALAIELAAVRVETFGLQQTEVLLDERLALLWSGQRSAPPRQQTLRAMLDWSYEILTDLEQQVLRQLAVFVGDFPLGAALAVLTDATLDRIQVLGAVENLVAKSMVATNRSGMTMRYRLLDTTRAYALDMSIHEAGLDHLAARHATYYQRWLEQADGEQPNQSDSAERTPQLADLGNVRAALEWCFGANGNVEIGVGLAAAAAPTFLAMSLFVECHRWSEQALVALDDATRGGREEMQLQAALGISLIFTHGITEAARVALNRGLGIAEERGDSLNQLRLLSPLHMFHFRLGDFKTALHLAERSYAVSEIIGDPAGIALAHNLFGHPLHLTGDLGRARLELEAALQPEPGVQRTRMTYLGFDNLAGGALARTLWLQGHPAQATVRARQTVNDAARTAHPVPLSIALIWAVSVFLWTGDLPSAEVYVDRFMALAESHSLRPYLAIGRGYQGELAIRRGDARNGVASLRGCLKDLHVARYEVLSTAFYIPLIQGLAAIDRVSEAITLVNEVIRRVKANGELTYLPELLRLKGGLLLSIPQPGAGDAEQYFIHSLELSRRQGALAWELRTAIDLAALLAAQGQIEGARAFLQPVFKQFKEGFDTVDLTAAQRLLAALS